MAHRANITLVGPQLVSIPTSLGKWSEDKIASFAATEGPQSTGLSVAVSAFATYPGSADDKRIIDNVWAAVMFSRTRSTGQVIVVDAKLSGIVNVPADTVSVGAMVMRNLAGGPTPSYSFSTATSEAMVSGSNEATLSWGYSLDPGQPLVLPMPDMLRIFGLGTGGFSPGGNPSDGRFVPPFAKSVEVANFGMVGGRFRLMDASGSVPTMEVASIPDGTAPPIGTVATLPVRPCDRLFDVTNNTLIPITGMVTFQLRF